MSKNFMEDLGMTAEEQNRVAGICGAYGVTPEDMTVRLLRGLSNNAVNDMTREEFLIHVWLMYTFNCFD